jgi:hypothetical protein
VLKLIAGRAVPVSCMDAAFMQLDMKAAAMQ